MTPIPRVLVLLLATMAGCQGSHAANPWMTGGGGQGGADGAVSDGAAGAASIDAASDAGDIPEVAPASCVEAPAALHAGASALSLPIETVLGGKPVVFGEPNDLPGGGTVIPLNFRFYVSHVALIDPNSARIPVDLVDAHDALEPYGVHLFVDTDEASHALRIHAPPGSYAGIELVLGIDDGCNSSPPAGKHEPLGPDSQMVWPMGFGYLFLRFEGQLAGAADAGAPPNVIHMGGFPGLLFAPTVTITGPFTIAARVDSMRKVRLDLGAVFQGAATPLAPSTAGTSVTPPDDPGYRLREHAPQVPLFTFAP